MDAMQQDTPCTHCDMARGRSPGRAGFSVLEGGGLYLRFHLPWGFGVGAKHQAPHVGGVSCQVGDPINWEGLQGLFFLINPESGDE
jgi:hypothetical protein